MSRRSSNGIAGQSGEEKAMERLVAVWGRLDGKDNPEVEEEPNVALDTLTVIHAAATFEWATGPLKW
jgi:hypothetical protein